MLQHCFCVMLWFVDHKAYEILAPQSAIKPPISCIDRRGLNHWTTKEVPRWLLLFMCRTDEKEKIEWTLGNWFCKAAAAVAKSLQSCPILCHPIDGSPPGSTVSGILQAGTLEWVAICKADSGQSWRWWWLGMAKEEIAQNERVWDLFSNLNHWIKGYGG